MAWEKYEKYDRLLLYASVGTEAETALLADPETNGGKAVAWVDLVGDDLQFRQGPLVSGDRFPRPVGPIVVPGPNDLLVVPILGFDSEFNRLGQGGGHYDRFISIHRDTLTVVGLGFLVQQLDRLPTEPHDQHLDAIATEAGLWEY